MQQDALAGRVRSFTANQRSRKANTRLALTLVQALAVAVCHRTYNRGMCSRGRATCRGWAGTRSPRAGVGAEAGGKAERAAGMSRAVGAVALRDER